MWFGRERGKEQRGAASWPWGTHPLNPKVYRKRESKEGRKNTKAEKKDER